MKRTGWSCAVALVIGLGGGRRTSDDAERREAPAAPAAGALERTIDLADVDLSALPRVTISIEEHGKQATVSGVAMADVLRLAHAPFGEELRGKNLALFVVVTARDGYRAVFALAEFDPAMSDRQILLVDRKDGQPLPDDEGPLRLVLPAEKRHARWVRQVVRVELRRA